jgi:hypothetical protein
LSEWKNDISNGPPSVFRPDLAPADFFLFEWLESELSSPWLSEIGELWEIVNEILSALATKTIAKVLANWIERLKQIIDTDGDYIWCPRKPI